MNEGTEAQVAAPPPLRLLLAASATAAWYDLVSDSERHSVVTRLQEVIAHWLDQPGVTFLASFDDDLLLAGDAQPLQRLHRDFTLQPRLLAHLGRLRPFVSS
jgi:hypothetical protein